MGKTIRRVTDTVGITTPKVPGVGGISISKQPFKIDEEAKKASTNLNQIRSNAEQDFLRTRGEAGKAKQALADAALGKGPSIAVEQMKQAQERSLAQQLAAAQATRGGSTSASARRLAQNISSSGQNIARDAGLARLKEQQDARTQFLQQSAADRDAFGESIRQSLEADTAAKRSLQDYERARSGAQATQSQLVSANQNAAAGRFAGLLGGGLQAAAMGGAFSSDETKKKDIKSAGKKVDKFLNALKEKEYKYKEPSAQGAKEGKQVGIMAQDLEKSELGKTLVTENADGSKMVDSAHGFGAVLAAQARLNERLNKLEKKKKV